MHWGFSAEAKLLDDQNVSEQAEAPLNQILPRAGTRWESGGATMESVGTENAWIVERILDRGAMSGLSTYGDLRRVPRGDGLYLFLRHVLGDLCHDVRILSAPARSFLPEMKVLREVPFRLTGEIGIIRVSGAAGCASSTATPTRAASSGRCTRPTS